MVAGAQGDTPEVVFFFGCFVATQLARPLQQERLQVVYSNNAPGSQALPQWSMDLKANACTWSQNKREVEQNTHQETTIMHEEHTPLHTHVDKQKRWRTHTFAHTCRQTKHNTHLWIRNMDEHHATGTVFNFLFWRITWNYACYISLFIVYIGFLIISCIYLCYLHRSDLIYSDCIYLCLTSIILVLFTVVVSFYVCVYMYVYKHLFNISWCILVYFCLLFIFGYLLFNYCDVYFIIFIVLFTFYMNMYVVMKKYFVSHSLVDIYSVLFGLTSLGVHEHTWARVHVCCGIDNNGIDPDQDHIEEHTYGKGSYIQKWTLFLWTWYVCIHEKYRLVWILK